MGTINSVFLRVVTLKELNPSPKWMPHGRVTFDWFKAKLKFKQMKIRAS